MRSKIATVLIMLCCELCVVNACAKSKDAKEKPNQSAYLKSIAPNKLKEDLNFLFKTIEEVHPNMYAHINKETYTLVKHELYKHIDHEMSSSEFFIYAQTAVSCLKDTHTRIFRPPDFTTPQITESIQELRAKLKKLLKEDKESNVNAQYIPAPRKKEYTGPYSYHFIPEYNTCLMVINWFGMPDQVKQYAKNFEETFKLIREKRTTNLIIDVRENSGGCGLAGDELLKYLANKPFRQIEKIEQRLVPEFFELCEQYGLNINRIMANEYGIDLQKIKSKRDYKPGITVTGQAPFKNPHKPSDQFKGSIYLLIGKPTFSAASNFAAAVKHFKIGILIGQQTSGTKDHYGQVIPIKLPNSELTGQISTAHFITAGGMEDSSGVKPDYQVRQKLQDAKIGRDTVLEFTLNLIGKSRKVL